MRRNSKTAPGLDEINKVVEEVRAARYAKKINRSVLVIDTNIGLASSSLTGNEGLIHYFTWKNSSAF
jgi:hypothetical protein